MESPICIAKAEKRGLIVKKNDRFELQITDMGVGGEGIGRYEGMTFFVKDALIGDTIRASVTKLKKNYGYARVEEILVPSPDRVEPRCPLHRRCGGCQIQALSYGKQLEYKERKVKNNLMRLGGFSGEELAVFEPIVGMDEPYRYRNKAQFPVGYDSRNRIVTGFYAARTHSIIPVEDCLLGVEENRPILHIVREWMEQYHILAYDEISGAGLVRHVLIRYGFATKEIMVCLIINGDHLPKQQELVDRLREIGGMTSISVNVNRERTNVILGKETRCIWGLPYITDYIHLRKCGTSCGQGEPEFARTDTAISYHISPQSFYQVNPLQTEKLYSTALEYAGLSGNECVWDLYCGIGTISLFLSHRARKVYGVEVVPQAIEDARENAKRNGITNVEFFVGRAEEVLPEFYRGSAAASDELHRVEEDRLRDDMRRPDVIVVDPPRKGCDEVCLSTMLQMQPKRIVYVSCDSATLARDLRVLVNGGYKLERGRVFDQFGNTVHTETVVQLSQRKPDDIIEVDLDIDELDLTASETKATYREIQQYVMKQTGQMVSNLYIAQVKRQCGIIERENYHKPKSEDSKQPHCPPEKEAAIMDALKYFKMI